MREIFRDIATAAEIAFPRRAVRSIATLCAAFTVSLAAMPVLIGAAAVSDDIASSIESRVAPVTTMATLYPVEPIAGGSLIYGSSIKLRACRFVGVDWRLVDAAGGEVRIPVDLRDQPAIRPIGEFSFGPWFVPVAPDVVLFRSRADVVHECHFGWQTKSPFWRPRITSRAG